MFGNDHYLKSAGTIMLIRRAVATDIEDMVVLSDVKRTQYSEFSPVFWRKAEGASEKQAAFFQSQLDRDWNIVLVSENEGMIHGFVIASIVEAPPVYDPGGKVCMIDDFAVASPELWQTVGNSLLLEVMTQAKTMGAVLSVVVCGPLDGFKRSMRQSADMTIASEWYVGAIE